MKFKVERTSIWNDDKPCAEAYEGDILFIGLGFSRVEKCWYVDINSLEELLKFEEKYGEIIIGTDWNYGKTPIIEIYDDYRE